MSSQHSAFRQVCTSTPCELDAALRRSRHPRARATALSGWRCPFDRWRAAARAAVAPWRAAAGTAARAGARRSAANGIASAQKTSSTRAAGSSGSPSSVCRDDRDGQADPDRGSAGRLRLALGRGRRRVRRRAIAWRRCAEGLSKGYFGLRCARICGGADERIERELRQRSRMLAQTQLALAKRKTAPATPRRSTSTAALSASGALGGASTIRRDRRSRCDLADAGDELPSAKSGSKRSSCRMCVRSAMSEAGRERR